MLNLKQLQAFDSVKNGYSIFITGPPGVGKSYTLKNIIEYLNENNNTYGITGLTGIASKLINGQTLHSFLGIGIGKKNVDEFETRINNILNEANAKAGKIGKESLSASNRFVIMVNAGSKGSDINISQLDTLIEEGGPWKFLALELKGGIQLQGGNLKDARSTFKELTDDANTPNNLRKRASEILKVLP